MTLENALPGAQDKINEYVKRIEDGESKESIMQGLPKSFTNAIEERLASKEAKDLEDKERIEEIRKEINPNQEKNEFSDFRVKNGETDEGFFWNEYRNRKAKDLKESGEFEWGKERIYFDVSIEDCEKLKDLAIKIASENHIALAFKHIDDEKTFPVHKDGKETRFVMNFVSSEDARKFYRELLKLKEYQELKPDRNVNYSGLRIDDLAEYASGFREKRGALERIMNAKVNEGGLYEYTAESGKRMLIGKDQFDLFKKQYEEIQEALEKEKELWTNINNQEG